MVWAVAWGSRVRRELGDQREQSEQRQGGQDRQAARDPDHVAEPGDDGRADAAADQEQEGGDPERDAADVDVDRVADGGRHGGLTQPEGDGHQDHRDRQHHGGDRGGADRRQHEGGGRDQAGDRQRARRRRSRTSSGPTMRGTNSANAALGTSSRPTCQASQPSWTSTAGTAISSANQAAGIAAAATALRTTVPLRTTEAGRKPQGRWLDPERHGRCAQHEQQETDHRNGEAGRRRLHQQHQAAGRAGHEHGADQVEAGAGAAAGQRVPEERQHQQRPGSAGPSPRASRRRSRRRRRRTARGSSQRRPSRPAGRAPGRAPRRRTGC